MEMTTTLAPATLKACLQELFTVGLLQVHANVLHTNATLSTL